MTFPFKWTFSVGAKSKDIPMTFLSIQYVIHFSFSKADSWVGKGEWGRIGKSL